MKYYTNGRRRYEAERQPTYARDASRVVSKGKPLNSFSFDSLPNDCCVYRDSRGCACALSTRHMNQTYPTETGGIDDD